MKFWPCLSWSFAVEENITPVTTFGRYYYKVERGLVVKYCCSNRNTANVKKEWHSFVTSSGALSNDPESHCPGLILGDWEGRSQNIVLVTAGEINRGREQSSRVELTVHPWSFCIHWENYDLDQASLSVRGIFQALNLLQTYTLINKLRKHLYQELWEKIHQFDMIPLDGMLQTTRLIY